MTIEDVIRALIVGPEQQTPRVVPAPTSSMFGLPPSAKPSMFGLLPPVPTPRPRSEGILWALLDDETKRLLVWEKGAVIPGLDPAVWRSDPYGDRLKWDDHGDQSSPFGWHMDHYPVPKALGGTDVLSNLRPLHCKRNTSHGGRLGGLLS